MSIQNIYIYLCQRSGPVRDTFVNGISKVFLYFLFYLLLEMILGIKKLMVGFCSCKNSVCNSSWVICPQNLAG